MGWKEEGQLGESDQEILELMVLPAAAIQGTAT